jgi:anaphase-promoting complex subunit 2
MTQQRPATAKSVPINATNNAVFKSVFNRESISQPVKHSKTSLNQSDEDDSVRQEASRLAKPLLGIETPAWVWGRDTVTPDGQPFRLPLSQCAKVSDIRPPQRLDIEAEEHKLQTSAFFRHLPAWQTQLGFQRCQKALAAVLNGLISSYVRSIYKGSHRSDVLAHMQFWVTNVLRLFVHCTKTLLSGEHKSMGFASEYLDESEVWHDRAVTHLGALRVEELFSVVASDDPTNSVVSNVVEDLRAFVTNPATRTYLTDRFIATLVSRALQPGAATIDILRLYISTIRAFGQLDPKGVLLDRVAKRVRRYLRERDDTVKVIVSGLLSQPSNESNMSADVLVEVADELHRSATLSNGAGNGDLDWDNMEWIPDPIDAALDYLKSEVLDVIGSLTSLFDSKEVFVKELQSLLADRLLASQASYEHEVQVLEHLKARFGDSALQACEVMLRDVLESSRVDGLINSDLQIDDKATSLPRMHAKVLSRLFWPVMSDQAFTLPDPIRKSQDLYAKGFEHVKQSRQISWVPSLGLVNIELELEDRTIAEEVLPYQAAVIYAFQDLPDSQVAKSVTELASELSMSSALVRSACIFWVAKRVLVEDRSERYAVLEALPEGSDVVMADSGSKQDASAAAAEAAAAQAAKEAEEEERKQKMAIYYQFVVSMLTNQGAMPLPRIAMMLNIVVPGGFPFSNEELKEFLAGMVKDGQLEVGPGGNYKAMT